MTSTPNVYTSHPDRREQLTRLELWRELTLHGHLLRHARAHPEREAIVDPPNTDSLLGRSALRMSYAELDRASDHLALQLTVANLSAGQRLMVQLPNTCELVVAVMAASKLGVVISPLPMQYSTHEIGSLGAALKPDAMLVCESFKGQPISIAARQALPGVPVFCAGKDMNCLALEPLSEDDRNCLAGLVTDDAHRTLTVCWTSGTTGTPKGVPRSHAMWDATARVTAEAAGYRDGERLLNPFPLVNMAAIGGFLFPAMELGCTLVLHHPLEPGLYLQQLQEERINFTIAPPALLNQLADAPALWQGYDFSVLRAVGSGSAPLSPHMIAVMEKDYGKPVINFYGSNEGITLFATPDTVSDTELRATCFPRLGVDCIPWESVGQALVRSKVIDPDTGEDITVCGEAGELCFAGATVFDGYLEHTDEAVFTDDGFFRTGDLVEICGTPAHYYRIVGRCKDIINRGGMKISPSEIDQLLAALPSVAEGAVCAYDDPDLGERVCACIVPAAQDAPPTLDTLCSALREAGLATFKLPERLLILDALPRNPMGKIVRTALSDQLQGATETQT